MGIDGHVVVAEFGTVPGRPRSGGCSLRSDRAGRSRSGDWGRWTRRTPSPWGRACPCRSPCRRRGPSPAPIARRPAGSTPGRRRQSESRPDAPGPSVGLSIASRRISARGKRTAGRSRRRHGAAGPYQVPKGTDQSVRVGGDDLAHRPGAQGLVGGHARRALDELDRAVAHGEVAAAGVHAPEAVPGRPVTDGDSPRMAGVDAVPPGCACPGAR